MPVEPRAPAAARRPERRTDDVRIADLESKVAVSENVHENIAASLERLEDGQGKIADKLDGLKDCLDKDHADLTRTAVGRETLRRFDGFDERVKTVETILQAERAFRDEIRGAIRLLKGLAAFTSTIAALMAIGWYMALIAGAKL